MRLGPLCPVPVIRAHRAGRPPRGPCLSCRSSCLASPRHLPWWTLSCWPHQKHLGCSQPGALPLSGRVEGAGLEQSRGLAIWQPQWGTRCGTKNRRENCERLGLPLPCRGPTGRLVSVFFYSLSPRGPRGPVPELHKNVSCREARDCWGLWDPHVGYVSPWFVFVSSLLLSFLFGKWRRPLSDFYVLVGVLPLLGERRLAHTGAQPWLVVAWFGRSCSSGLALPGLRAVRLTRREVPVSQRVSRE